MTDKANSESGELAAACFRYFKEHQDEDDWAYDKVASLLDSDPEGVWKVVLDLIESAGAAGPTVSMLCQNNNSNSGYIYTLSGGATETISLLSQQRQTQTCTLGGTIATGDNEAFVVNFPYTAFNYTIQPGDTLATVASNQFTAPPNSVVTPFWLHSIWILEIVCFASKLVPLLQHKCGS